MFDSDGLLSLSVVLFHLFVQIEKFYCSVVSDLENYFTKMRLRKFSRIFDK